MRREERKEEGMVKKRKRYITVLSETMMEKDIKVRYIITDETPSALHSFHQPPSSDLDSDGALCLLLHHHTRTAHLLMVPPLPRWAGQVKQLCKMGAETHRM